MTVRTSAEWRRLQLAILEGLLPHYPMFCNTVSWPDGFTEQEFTSMLWYLQEHGLVNTGLEDNVLRHGDSPPFVGARLTSTGFDFLADDGGLSAILGVVTVKLHDDTIRDLLLARVDSAPDLDEPAKKKLKDTIKGLPAEALKTFTIEGLKAGLNHLPDIGHWLMTVANTLT